jgi:hypothetical protein
MVDISYEEFKKIVSENRLYDFCVSEEAKQLKKKVAQVERAVEKNALTIFKKYGQRYYDEHIVGEDEEDDWTNSYEYWDDTLSAQMEKIATFTGKNFIDHNGYNFSRPTHVDHFWIESTC